jgi:hypothetical protein
LTVNSLNSRQVQDKGRKQRDSARGRGYAVF